MSELNDIYIMRVFATSSDIPSPRAIADHLNSHGFPVHIELTSTDLDTNDWTQISIHYAADHALLQLAHESLHSDEPLSDALRALMDATADAKDRRGSRRVLALLAEANHLFELSIPPDYDWNAQDHLVSTALLNYLETQTAGLIQADGEGYYQNNRILLVL